MAVLSTRSLMLWRFESIPIIVHPELLVRDQDLSGIAADLMATGIPIHAASAQAYAAKPVSDHVRTMYHLSCDVPWVEVPDLMAPNVVLMDDDFDPVGPDAVSLSVRSRRCYSTASDGANGGWPTPQSIFRPFPS
ncbi:MAG: hypothetical protein M1826_000452 [Phylliscum demangeonii]|nr:MAG: hypothetical protein M1826_000452 [Phylliscum demangeonii]